MKGFLYIVFIGFVLGVFFLISYLIPSDPLLDSAREADRLMNNSRLYAKEHAYRRSLSHLDMAVRAIKEIEQKLDKEDHEIIEVALKDLKKVSNEIKMRKPVDSDMHHAFAKALNALTYAELKVTEHFVETDQYHEAKVAMKYGMIHIQNALKFVGSEDKEYEMHIYNEMDSLMKDESKDKKAILQELERMESELNDFVTH